MLKLNYAVMEYTMPEWATGDCRKIDQFDDVDSALILTNKLNKENKNEESTFFNTIVFKVEC